MREGRWWSTRSNTAKEWRPAWALGGELSNPEVAGCLGKSYVKGTKEQTIMGVGLREKETRRTGDNECRPLFKINLFFYWRILLRSFTIKGSRDNGVVDGGRSRIRSIFCVLFWDGSCSSALMRCSSKEGKRDSQEQGVKLAEVITLSRSEQVGN